jgi:hypothetical protein
MFLFRNASPFNILMVALRPQGELRAIVTGWETPSTQLGAQFLL